MDTKTLTESLVQQFSPEEWITAQELQMRGCEGRIDVAAVRMRQFKRKEIRAYEVKVSRSDFLVDVGRQKWRKYLDVCHRVYFATPAGLLKKSEIPPGAGLFVLGDGGWHVVKHAKYNEPPNLDVDAVLSILFANQRDRTRTRNLQQRLDASAGVTLQGVAKKIGGEIARRLAGGTPRVESDASQIYDEVHSLFGSARDAVEALRFAARFNAERSVLAGVAAYFSDLTKGGLDDKSKRTLNQKLNFLSKKST